MVVGALLWMACGSDDAALHEEQLAKAERDCAALTVAECRQHTECHVSGGTRVMIEQQCLGESVELGCQANGSGCDTALTIGTDPQGEHWWFGNTCLPEGFSFSTGGQESEWVLYPSCSAQQPTMRSCQTRSAAECAKDERCVTGDDGSSCQERSSATTCEQKDVSACALDDRCMVMSGLRIERAQHCLGDSVALGCATQPKGCTAALMVGTDAQGQSYWFSSGCLPEQLSATGADEAISWPLCNPPPPAPAKPCVELSGDNCEVDRSDCTAIQALAFEPARGCVRGPKKVGCVDKQRVCAESISYGRDRDGQAWQFSRDCQLEGFTPLMPSAAEQPQGSWPHCAT